MERIFFLGDSERFYFEENDNRSLVTLASGFSLRDFLEKHERVTYDLLVIDGMAGSSAVAAFLDTLEKESRLPMILLVSPQDFPLTGALEDHYLVTGLYSGPPLLNDLLETCRSLMEKGYTGTFSGDERASCHGMLGNSEGMKTVWRKIDKYAADGDAPVLITGENGTGKELVARAIYEVGHGTNRPFVPYQASYVDDQFLASDLFGVKKGAYTGAESREGLLVQAGGGVFFLDEIGLLSQKSQMAFLRVLQEKKIRPLGSSEEKSVDFRLISATNEDLWKSVEEGLFRTDLFHRINTLMIHVPPLRERMEDVPLLADFFCTGGGTDVSLTKGAMDKLLNYDWPGNIRELQNVIKRALIEREGQEKIETRHILFN